MSKNPSQKELDEIRENFNFFDDDKNGLIELDEFIKLLKVIDPTSTIKQAEQGFSHIDKDKSGSIDFGEFIIWWESYWWQY